MKNILAILSIFIVTSSFAGIRERCENYHLATANVKYHQYSVLVDWSKIDDRSHEKLDNILFGNMFEVVKTQDMKESKTLYHIKETGTYYAKDYENELSSLVKMTIVDCLYDLKKVL